MALSDNPTYADVKAAYKANVGYDLPGGSTSMATEFIKACRLLQSQEFSVKRTVHGGRSEEVEVDQQYYLKQEERAIAWLRSQQQAESGSSVVHPDFTDFRS